MTAVKTFGPAGRRRRRCDMMQQRVLELPGYTCHQHQQQQQQVPDVVPTTPGNGVAWDTAPPITPPAAFLPPGYKKGFGSLGESCVMRDCAGRTRKDVYFWRRRSFARAHFFARSVLLFFFLLCGCWFFGCVGLLCFVIGHIDGDWLFYILHSRHRCLWMSHTH